MEKMSDLTEWVVTMESRETGELDIYCQTNDKGYATKIFDNLCKSKHFTGEYIIQLVALMPTVLRRKD